jgi:gas vesicle protein
MGDGYDRFDNEGASGSSFVMGLLTGTVLGAGLGMLFAPKSGSELRNQLSTQAGNLANTASEQYRRAAESAGQWAERGRGMVDKARDVVAKGADEAQRYVRDSAGAVSGQPSTASAGSYPSGEGLRGSSSEQVRGESRPGSHPGETGTPPRRS